MGTLFEQLTDEHIQFIEHQHLYFVGTAASEGSVNISPKGMDSLRVQSHSSVCWLNLTGSGNETAAHIKSMPRMTVMFCSFDTQPLILRLYGQATVTHAYDERWEELTALFPQYIGARQVFELSIESVQTSCGFAVPFYEMKGERPVLRKWAEKKGRDGVEQYQQDRNAVSLDGFDTGILKSE